MKKSISFNKDNKKKRVWGKPSMFPAYIRLLMWVTGNTEYSQEFEITIARIAHLYKTNGPKYTFQYLKEGLRLIIQSLGGNPSLTVNLLGVRVKRDKLGLPTILPLRIRAALSDRVLLDKTLVKSILTIMSLFRSFKFVTEPDLGPITRPFSGVTQTLESAVIRKALRNLKLNFIQVRRAKSFYSSKAGPNISHATFGSVYDALAFVHNPSVLYNLLRILWLHRGYTIILSLFLINLICLPVYIFYNYLSSSLVSTYTDLRSRLGKLSIVYDQPGKARVVAITNWWIQVALKPLHESLFDFLRTVPMDGTFEQDKPLKLLLSRVKDGQKLYSFDLSNATDRLPIALQEQILSFIYEGSYFWRKVLDFEWLYSKQSKKSKDGKRKLYFPIVWVKYQVGQPMGAYSSWAMLALTHHVIIQYCSIVSGRRGLFRDYCVLGDDVIIANDDVARVYRHVMGLLGVDINDSKTIESFVLCEFAKLWFYRENGVFTDISPLGAANMIQVVTDPRLVSALLIEAMKKNFITSIQHCFEIIDRMGDFRLKGRSLDRSVVSYTLLWYDSPVFRGQQSTSLMKSLNWLSRGPVSESHNDKLVAVTRSYIFVTSHELDIELNNIRDNIDNFWQKLSIEFKRIGLFPIRIVTYLGVMFSLVPNLCLSILFEQRKLHEELRDRLFTFSWDLLPLLAPNKDDVIKEVLEHLEIGDALGSLNITQLDQRSIIEYNRRIKKFDRMVWALPDYRDKDKIRDYILSLPPVCRWNSYYK